MSVLITGGAGFVGISIAEALLERGSSVVALDVNPYPEHAKAHFEQLPGTLRHVQGDVLDQALLEGTILAHGVSTIVHTAAITPNIDREIADARSVVSVNCVSTAAVLGAATKLKVTRVIHTSTGAVYGRGQWEQDELFEASSERRPESLYEITKVAAEQLVQRHRQLTRLDAPILRLGDVFGAWEYRSGVRDVLSAPFQVTELARLRRKAWLPRPGLKYWVYSRDVGKAVHLIVTANRLQHDVYHVSSGYRWSIAEWCRLLSERFPGFSHEITDLADRVNVEFRPDHSPLNIERLIEDTGFTPQYDLQTSFDDYMSWIERSSGMASRS
jgi:nucleoside-diphosphate-sugar epimerase